jgi:hypothetical protein
VIGAGGASEAAQILRDRLLDEIIWLYIRVSDNRSESAQTRIDDAELLI